MGWTVSRYLQKVIAFSLFNTIYNTALIMVMLSGFADIHYQMIT